MDIDGNAGTVARLLGAVFGRSAVNNRDYVGIGLRLIDGGMSSIELAALAIDAAGASAPRSIVDLLWTSVVGSSPTTDQAKPYVDLLTSGSLSVGQLALFASTTSLNETNINLVGLAATGLAYIDGG